MIFLQFIEYERNIGPVEADRRRAFLQFGGTLPLRQSGGDSRQNAVVRTTALAALLAFHALPGFGLGGGIGDAGLSENVRMPVGHFAVDGRNHVVEREQTLLLRQLGMEHHLEQEIAEFVAQVIRLTALDGIGDLIGFFDGVRRQGAEVLLQIPGTAAFGIAQGPHDYQQLLNRRAHSQSCQPMDRSPTAMKWGLSRESLLL